MISGANSYRNFHGLKYFPIACASCCLCAVGAIRSYLHYVCRPYQMTDGYGVCVVHDIDHRLLLTTCTRPGCQARRAQQQSFVNKHCIRSFCPFFIFYFIFYLKKKKKKNNSRKKTTTLQRSLSTIGALRDIEKFQPLPVERGGEPFREEM